MGLYVMSVSEMGSGGRMINGYGDSCLSDDQEKGFVGEENMMVIEDDEVKRNDGCFLYSASSDSSIGKNSDEDCENVNAQEEVQSGFNEGENEAFDSVQLSVEDRPERGLSRYFSGKTKSFARLADALSASSIKEIEKVENAYIRKRKYLRARKLASDRHNSSRLKSSGGVSKRSTTSTRTTLALGVAMTNSSNRREIRENPDSRRTSISSLSPHRSQITQTEYKSSW